MSCFDDGEGDGQVVAAALLGQIGGGKVHGYLIAGDPETRIGDGSAHPVLAFAHGCFGKANDQNLWQALRDEGLNGHPWRLYADLGPG